MRDREEQAPGRASRGAAPTPVCVSSQGTEVTLVKLVAWDLRAELNALPS